MVERVAATLAADMADTLADSQAEATSVVADSTVVAVADIAKVSPWPEQGFGPAASAAGLFVCVVLSLLKPDLPKIPPVAVLDSPALPRELSLRD